MEQEHIMTTLQQKVAVVPGGTSGIGLAIAGTLGTAGAVVVIAARDGARGAAAVRELRAAQIDARYVFCDVRSSMSIEQLMETVATDCRGIDIIINCAGLEGPIVPLHEYPDDALENILATNFAGAALVMKHGLSALLARGGGIIVNVACTIGTVVPLAGAAIYGGTKAAIVSMTGAAASGYRDRGIRIYAISPWITDTPMLDRLTNHSAEAKQQFGKINPGGALIDPKDVAQEVLRIITDEHAIATGMVLEIDRPVQALA